MDIGTLAQHILDTHHALLHRELPRLDAALRAGDTPSELMAPWSELKRLLESHLMKEEAILFPQILALAGGGAPGGCGLVGPITQMNHEHRLIAELEARVRAASAGAGPESEALIGLLDDLVVHATLEDEELFPAALDASGEVQPAPNPLAERVAAHCQGAAAWHAAFRARLDAFDAAFAEQALSPRLMAPWGHFTRELRAHFEEEEAGLFPALLGATRGEPVADNDRVLLAEMQTELDVIRTIADALRAAAPEVGELEEALLELLDDLEEHARRESEELWPDATALLGARPRPAPRSPRPQRAAPPRRGGPLRRAARRLKGWLQG